MQNQFKVNDIIVQTEGPCRNSWFRVVEVDGALVRVKPDPPLPGVSNLPEWSHHANFRLKSLASKD